MSEKEEGAVISKRKHKQWINQASVSLSSCHLAFINKGQVCCLMWFFHGHWPAGWWQLQKCLSLARLAPSQHSCTATQDYLTESWLRQSRYEPQWRAQTVPPSTRALGSCNTLLGPAKILTCQLQGKRMPCNNFYLGNATQSRACPCS